MLTAYARHRSFWWLGSGVLLVSLVGGVSAGYRQAAYRTKILPHVRLGSVELGGLTREQAEGKLQKAWDAITAVGIPVKAGQYDLVLNPIVTSPTDPDLTYELVRFDAARNAALAFAPGHSGLWWERWLAPLITSIQKSALSPQFEVNTEQVTTYLRQNLPKLEETPRPARVSIDVSGNLNVLPEVPGTTIDVVDFSRQLVAALGPLQVPVPPLQVNLSTVIPSLTEARVLAALPRVRELVRETDLVFTFDHKTWRVPAVQWHQWLEVRGVGAEAEAGLNATAAADRFSAIGAEVNQSFQDARVELVDSRVTTFVPSRQGRAVDVAATLRAAEALLRAGPPEPLPLTVQTIEPSVTTADANSLGIAEIIGTGTSNFTGSPKNRRANIRTGAAKLNGVIIKLDEEFSLLAALGNIDAKAGYLQELVIKGDKTIPEFGGGLCQIGTTMFRAALASGLPILERRSHSYRVSYYEPAGTDATIYDPKPDFRFKNDTGRAILIQTRVEGDNLIFELWGTKDGRRAEQTKPIISNLVQPSPTKQVPTEDLPVGQKKCTEKAHVGADAKFTYTVTYADGRKVEQVFKSHYVPWQEVCLVGVPKGTLPVSGAPAGDGTLLLPTPDAAGVRGN